MPTDSSLASGGSAPEDRTAGDLYQTLALKVKEGGCVLFLGPEALLAEDSDGKWRPLTDSCAFFLAGKYKLNLAPDESYDLPHVTSVLRLSNRSTDNVLQEDVAAFYRSVAKNCKLHPMLEQLTELPFRMVINTTPDNFVTQLYDGLGLPYLPGFYNYYKPATGFHFDFEADKRIVVYNLFGFYEKPESLVLSYRQQLTYIKKIVNEQQNERLPDTLTNAFRDLRYHLFLGFDFEEWGLRLLLDTLYKNVRENVQPYSYLSKGGRPAGPGARVFYQGEFGMQFPEDDMETFVARLVDTYKNLGSDTATPPNQTPKAHVLILYNETADNDGYELLLKHLRTVNAQTYTLQDATGEGDINAWLRQKMEQCQVVLPLLSADFYSAAHISDLLFLKELAAKNNPRKGFLVMPILLKAVSLDGPLGGLATIRPSDRQPIIGSGKEQQYAADIAEGLKKYIENLSRS